MTTHGPLVLGELTLPPADEWRPGVAEWTFLLVREGCGYCFADAAVSELSAGDAVLLSQPQGSELRASRIGRLTLSFFSLDTGRLAGLLSLLEQQQLATLASSKPRIHHFAASHPVARRFLAAGELAGGEQPLELRLNLLQVFAAAVELESGRHARPEQKAGAPNARDRFLKMTGELTEEEFWGQPVARLAERCRCTERHFSRLFHQQFGHSLTSGLGAYRLKRARSLLEETSLPVADIALECGYRQPGVFNAAFKRQFGATPTEFRKAGDRPEASNSTGGTGADL